MHKKLYDVTQTFSSKFPFFGYKDIQVNQNLLSLQFGGEELSYDQFKLLIQIEEGFPTKVCPKLTLSHIYPDNWQKMNVKLATQVINNIEEPDY